MPQWRDACGVGVWSHCAMRNHAPCTMSALAWARELEVPPAQNGTPRAPTMKGGL
jgi:hypothetical protein